MELPYCAAPRQKLKNVEMKRKNSHIWKRCRNPQNQWGLDCSEERIGARERVSRHKFGSMYHPFLLPATFFFCRERCYLPSITKNQKNILKGKACLPSWKQFEFHFRVLSWICLDVRVQQLGFQIWWFTGVCGAAANQLGYFLCWLPDSGWHLLPSLEIGRVLQVCTGRGQVSREKKSFDHEQMNRDEALNS